MLRAALELGSVLPERAEDRVAGAQRVHAQLRRAEVGRAAMDRDLGDQEADLGGADLQPGRLDVDGQIRARKRGRGEVPEQRLHAVAAA
jgi:hypothetical protein